MNKPYQPIACQLYDQLEILAMHQRQCEIVFHDAEFNQQILQDTIIEMKIIEKQEFVILKSGQNIRLDRLLLVNGIDFKAR